jgi:hypothetical protein
MVLKVDPPQRGNRLVLILHHAYVFAQDLNFGRRRGNCLLVR